MEPNETNPRISQAANAWHDNQPVQRQLDAIDSHDALMAEVVHFLDWASTVDERFLPLLQIRATDLLRKVRSL